MLAYYTCENNELNNMSCIVYKSKLIQVEAFLIVGGIVRKCVGILTVIDEIPKEEVPRMEVISSGCRLPLWSRFLVN